MSRTTRVEAEYRAQLRAAAERFGDHESMSEGRILRWLTQFADDDLRVAEKILTAIRYYGAMQIRTLTKALVAAVASEVESDMRRCVFVPVGEPGSGSSLIARVLRNLQETRGSRVATMADVPALDSDAFSTLVCLEDFSGTGDHLTEWWATVEPLLRPKPWRLVFGVLVLHERAQPRLEAFAERLITAEPLDESDDVFASTNRHFRDDEKPCILHYCEKTKCSEDFVRGYGGSGLLIAFKHGCPNNSLPILWCETSAWTALFNRRGL